MTTRKCVHLVTGSYFRSRKLRWRGCVLTRMHPLCVYLLRTFFGHVTLTLTRWPSYVRLWKYTGRVIESYRLTDRHTESTEIIYTTHGWSIIFYYINRTRSTVKNEKKNNNSNKAVCREQSTYLRTLWSKFRCRVRRSLLEITHTRSKSAEVKKVSSYFFIFFSKI